MPNRRFVTTLAALAFSFVCALPLQGQHRQLVISFDGLVGLGGGWGGGDRVDRGFPVADLLATIGARPERSPWPMVGLDWSADWQMNGDLLCLPGPDGACRPQYPAFQAVSLVVGREWRSASGITARILVGPGYYIGSYDRNTSTSTAPGVLGRMDLALPLAGGISVVAASRTGWIPRMRGQWYAPEALMLGLRLDAGP